jgi:uncharacterized protein
MRVPRFLSPPAGNLLLLGPPGVGKTAWTMQHFPDAVRIDLRDVEMARLLAARPARLRELVLAARGARQIVLDEVLSVDGVLAQAQTLMRELRGLRWVLTASSARDLPPTPGITPLTLHPLMAAELGDGFDLGLALQAGTLPVIWAGPRPELAVRAYNGMLLRDEIARHGLTRHPGDLARTLEALTGAQGAVLNLAETARIAQVPRKTVEAHVRLLAALGLIFRVPVFGATGGRALAAHMRLHFFDLSLFRANLPEPAPHDAAPHEADDAALRGLVAQQLRAWCAYSPGGHVLSHWLTRSNVAVDCVVRGASKFHAIGISTASQPRTRDVRALNAFGQDHPSAKLWLLHRGNDAFTLGAVRCEPVTRFLRALVPGSFPHH